MRGGIKLLVGERDVFTYSGKDSTSKQPAEFIITNWALRVCYEDPRPHTGDMVIPHSVITRVSKKGGKKGRGFYGIKVKVSTCASLKIRFSRKAGLRPKFFDALNDAIANRMKFDTCTWASITSYKEKIAPGLEEYKWIPNDFCATYGPELLVPSGCDLALIKECSQYRTRERIPILSYVYPGNNAPLLRSSQPRTGIVNSASKADQDMLATWTQGRKLAILDCRPKINAVVNQLAGGGYESMSHYDNATFEFLDIPNIHRVRECYIEMYRGLAKNKERKAKNWGKLILQLIHGASIAAEKLKHNEATLVHCTDGWDRTAQISALTQVLVNPETRTIEGFHELIQKEWCDAGHMFGLRNSQEPHRHSSQSSPIFAQFIDAVFQLMHQTPNEFEFNSSFLAFILFHSYAQLYGDFLGNCWKDRSETERPPSLWDCFRDPEFKATMTNKSYDKTVDQLPSSIAKYTICDLICTGPVFGCSSDVPLYACPPETEVLPADLCKSVIPVNREALVSNFEFEPASSSTSSDED